MPGARANEAPMGPHRRPSEEPGTLKVETVAAVKQPEQKEGVGRNGPGNNGTGNHSAVRGANNRHCSNVELLHSARYGNVQRSY